MQQIDHDKRIAYIDRTKDQIKHAPEYDKETFDTAEYRNRVAAYYDDSYRTAPAGAVSDGPHRSTTAISA